MRLRLLLSLIILCTPVYANNVQEDGLRINVEATNELNMFDNLPHSTVLALYQYKTLEGLKQLMIDKKGISVLLKGEKYSKDVISAKREVIVPGEKKIIYWDRHEDANYVALVGGFFLADTNQMVKVFPIKVKQRSPFFWLPKDPEKADSVISIKLQKREIR